MAQDEDGGHGADDRRHHGASGQQKGISGGPLAIKIKEIVEGNKASFAFPSQSIYVEKK